MGGGISASGSRRSSSLTTISRVLSNVAPEVSNDSGRRAVGEHAIGDVTQYDRARANDRAGADPQPAGDDRSDLD